MVQGQAPAMGQHPAGKQIYQKVVHNTGPNLAGKQ